VVETITQATLQLYFQCCEKLPRTPIKFHYTFNLRDIGRIYEGLYLTCTDKFKTKGNVIKVWRNEAHRVFADRLISEKDVNLVTVDLIPGIINQYFKDCAEEALVNPLVFADFGLTEPEEDDDGSEDPRLYEDM
jgi:dynein heavy chain